MTDPAATPSIPPFNMDLLTMGEISTAERLSGQSTLILNDPTTPSTALKTALYFVWRKRFEPTFKWNDAQKAPATEVFTCLGLIDADEDNADEDEVEDVAEANPTQAFPRHA